MCMQCATDDGGRIGLGHSHVLQRHAATWLTPARMRAATIALLLPAVAVSSIGLTAPANHGSAQCAWTGSASSRSAATPVAKAGR